jgi:serine/threonine protein kinase
MAEPHEIGDIFAEKYRVEEILGKGAMAMVLGARHLGLDEPVAIKVLLPKMVQAPGMVERFVREARAASKIKSEHVIRVTDVDTLKNGVPFMIMERLDGTDLDAVCKERGQLPIEEAVGHILDACEALAEAHELGIIHRDLKPANLFLARRSDGTTLVKVIDFGISKVSPRLAGAGHVTTEEGALIGSPSYMSPEQMESASDVDPRADIWALGTILYRLLTGELPFRADRTTELVNLVLNGSPVRPRSLRPNLPKALEAVLLRCLQKNRARRFSTVSALATALVPFAGKRAAGPERGPALPEEAAERSMTPARPWLRISALVAAGVWLLLLCGVWLWLWATASRAPSEVLDQLVSSTTPAKTESSVPTASKAVEPSPAKTRGATLARPSR